MGLPLELLSSYAGRRRLRRPGEPEESPANLAGDTTPDTTTEPAAQQGPTPMERPQYEAYQTAVQEMPQLERSPGWKQALGYAAEAFRPTRGTGLGERLRYRNLDEVTASQQKLKPLERLAQLEEAQGDQAMREREAGVRERGVAVQEQEAKQPKTLGAAGYFDPRTEQVVAPPQEADKPPMPPPPVSVGGKLYNRVWDQQQGMWKVEVAPGSPEPATDAPKRETVKLADGRTAYVTNDDQGSPVLVPFGGENPRELVRPTPAPQPAPAPRLRQLADGRFAQEVTDEQGNVSLVPVEGENPVRPSAGPRRSGSFTMAPPPVGGAAPPAPSPAPPESRGRLMNRQEFIADFTNENESKRPPTEAEIDEARKRGLWQ